MERQGENNFASFPRGADDLVDTFVIIKNLETFHSSPQAKAFPVGFQRIIHDARKLFRADSNAVIPDMEHKEAVFTVGPDLYDAEIAGGQNSMIEGIFCQGL